MDETKLSDILQSCFVNGDAIERETVILAQTHEASYKLLNEALNEAARFANARLPRDSREIGANESYYKSYFLELASANLNGGTNDPSQ